MTLWLAVLIYWFGSLFVNLEGMQALVLPVAAVCVLLPGLFPGSRRCRTPRGIAFRAHLRSRCSPTACSRSPRCTRC